MQGSTQFEKAMKMAAWISTANKPVLDKDGALRGFTEDHPIYKGKFWIYEEKRLASYDEWRNFYERQANEKQG
jgi:hypothetical protein